MSAFYNEHDPKAAAWLRELIADGLIADGIVDERSIIDIKSGELPVRDEGGGSGFWSDFDIIPCRDGKARRVKRGLQCLVNGLPRGVVPSGDPSGQEAQTSAEARVMRLRGYGNAIVPQVAAEFIRSFIERTP